MKEITASEAARNFSAVLDAIERGESLLVTRSGRRIASITPAAQANGKAVNAVLARWSDSDLFDDDFLPQIAETLRAADPESDRDPWSK